MNTRLLNIAILALLLASMIAPLLPTTPVAHAQQEVKVEIVETNAKIENGKAVIETANANEEYYVIFNITDYEIAGPINVTIKVGTTENEVTVYPGEKTGSHIGKLLVRTIQLENGELAGKVYYYPYNSSSGTFGEGQELNGLLHNGDTVVINYRNRDYVIIEFKVKTTYRIEVYGRKIGDAYWLPRLCNCGELNVTRLYNAMEWRIKSTRAIFTVNNNYTVELYAVNIASGATTPKINITFKAIDSTTLVPANETEAEKIKKLILRMDDIAEPWIIEGNDFSKPLAEGDRLRVIATIYNNDNIMGQTEAEMRLFTSIAVIQISQIDFENPAIKITVIDADANLDTMKKEKLPYEGYMAPIMQFKNENGVALNIIFEETKENSGVFINETLTIFQLYELGVINETDNVIDYNFTELRVNSPTGPVLCYHTGSVNATYYFASIDTAEKQVILRNAIQCCMPSKVTLIINDRDLSLPGARGTVVAIASVPSGKDLFKVTAYYYYNGSRVPVPALVFTLYLVDEKGKAYNVTTRENLNIYFVKQSEGIVYATIDLTKINWEAVNEQANHMLKKLVIYVNDRFNPNLTITRWLNITVNLQNVTINTDLNNSMLPISFRIVNSHLNRANAVASLASCPGCYPWINDTRSNTYSQVVHITIHDPGANVDCCRIDTIPAGKLNVSLVLQLPNGSTYTLFNSNSTQVQIPLYAVESDGTWRGYGTCYIRWTDFTETAPNSSDFVGTLEIYSMINIYDNDGNLLDTIRVAGCPSVWLHGAKMKLLYTSPAVGRAEYTITFATMDAELYINKTVIRYGDIVNITVYDPDANLDNNARESVMVEISFYCPLTRSNVIREIWLRETAPNSSVFNGTLVIDSSLAGSCNDLYCAPLNVIYVDRTPNVDTTIEYGLQQLERNLSLKGEIRGLLIFAECDCNKVLKTENMTYQPKKGVVKLYYKFPGYMRELAPFNGTWINVTNKVIPAFLDVELKIVVKDADMNRRVNVRDHVRGQLVSIEVPGVTPGPVSLQSLGFNDLRETNTSTGIFESNVFTLRQLFDALRNAGYITVPPGKTVEQVYTEILAGLVASKQPIKVYYHDGQAACQAQICGNVAPADIEASVRVVDITGNITIVDSVTRQPHNDSIYSCGCVIGSCPSATGDVIDIIVEDLSLLRYVTAGSLRITGNLTMQLSVNNTVRPLIYGGGFRELVFAGYRNITIDGVEMPVPIFEHRGIVIYCQQPLASTRGYIVAPVGSKVYFTYIDPINESGAKDMVTTVIGIGIPGFARNITQTVTIVTDKLELRVFNGTAFVKTTTIQRGQPAAIYVPLNYDPIAVRTVVGGNTFAVLMVIRDNTGKVLLFQYTYVSMGQSSVTFSLPSTITQSLQPGKYTIEIYAVTTMDDLVRISPIAPLQVTIQ